MCKVHTEAVAAVALVNTNVMTGWGMCKVCTEAVDAVALWTQTSSQVRACVEYGPKQSLLQHFEQER